MSEHQQRVEQVAEYCGWNANHILLLEDDDQRCEIQDVNEERSADVKLLEVDVLEHHVDGHDRKQVSNGSDQRDFAHRDEIKLEFDGIEEVECR